MRRLAQAFVLFALVSALPLWCASIDGTWVGEMSADLNQHSESRKAEQPKLIPIHVVLKAKGNVLDGVMTIDKGNKPDIWLLRKGRIVGNHLSFEVYRQTKSGLEEMRWDGVLNGDVLKLSRGLKGLGRQVLLHRQR